MSAPTHLLPFDLSDTLAVSSALFERIVEATNSTALKNRWFRESDKREVTRAIVEAGERAARSFARDFAPPGFAYERVIGRVMPCPDKSAFGGLSTPHPRGAGTREIQFRVHINGNAYERLVAAICSQTGF
jgi:hypothetical protein